MIIVHISANILHTDHILAKKLRPRPHFIWIYGAVAFDG